MQTVGSPLDDTDVVVQSLDEPEGDLVARIAVGGDAVPVPVDHLGELLVGLEALPFQLRPPVLEEFPRPRLAAIVPYLPEGFLQQIGGVEPFVRGEQSLEVLARRALEVVRMSEQGVLLALDERAAFAAEPRVFLLAHLVERIAEVTQDVELVEQDRRLGSVPGGRVAERLPHVHDRKTHPAGLLFPEKPVELVHALLGAIFPAEPDRPLPMQVADHDAIDVTLADGDLVDPQRLGTGLGGALELHPHVAHLQTLDRLPIEIHLLGDVLDRAGAAAATDIAGKTLRVQRVLQQELQPLALHLPAPTAVDPPHFQVQVNPVRTARQIPNPSPRTVVPGPVSHATCAADSFFLPPTRVTNRARGSPNRPCTFALRRSP